MQIKNYNMKAKTLKIILIISISITLTANKLNTYCDGYYYGWQVGYCNNNEWCIAPTPPNCPIVRYNEKGDYASGYNRGVIDGYQVSPYKD
jgi:hypothetical protein